MSASNGPFDDSGGGSLNRDQIRQGVTQYLLFFGGRIDVSPVGRVSISILENYCGEGVNRGLKQHFLCLWFKYSKTQLEGFVCFHTLSSSSRSVGVRYRVSLRSTPEHSGSRTSKDVSKPLLMKKIHGQTGVKRFRNKLC